MGSLIVCGHFWQNFILNICVFYCDMLQPFRFSFKYAKFYEHYLFKLNLCHRAVGVVVQWKESSQVKIRDPNLIPEILPEEKKAHRAHQGNLHGEEAQVIQAEGKKIKPRNRIEEVTVEIGGSRVKCHRWDQAPQEDKKGILSTPHKVVSFLSLTLMVR